MQAFGLSIEGEGAGTTMCPEHRTEMGPPERQARSTAAIDSVRQEGFVPDTVSMIAWRQGSKRMP